MISLLANPHFFIFKLLIIYLPGTNKKILHCHASKTFKLKYMTAFKSILGIFPLPMNNNNKAKI